MAQGSRCGRSGVWVGVGIARCRWLLDWDEAAVERRTRASKRRRNVTVGCIWKFFRDVDSRVVKVGADDLSKDLSGSFVPDAPVD